MEGGQQGSGVKTANNEQLLAKVNVLRHDNPSWSQGRLVPSLSLRHKYFRILLPAAAPYYVRPLHSFLFMTRDP
ncbi:hypothetical protein J6590_020846 [Homalodisca vitripennis]|nr:hypothetical protein J6590_020846 [Homalodisca vitripennis]